MPPRHRRIPVNHVEVLLINLLMYYHDRDHIIIILIIIITVTTAYQQIILESPHVPFRLHAVTCYFSFAPVPFSPYFPCCDNVARAISRFARLLSLFLSHYWQSAATSKTTPEKSNSPPQLLTLSHHYVSARDRKDVYFLWPVNSCSECSSI